MEGRRRDKIRAMSDPTADRRNVLADALGRPRTPAPGADPPSRRRDLDRLRDPRTGGGRHPPPGGARRAGDRGRGRLRSGAGSADGTRSGAARRALRGGLGAAREHAADGGQPALGAGAGTERLRGERRPRAGGGDRGAPRLGPGAAGRGYPRQPTNRRARRRPFRVGIAGAHALQHRRARHGRLRHGARGDPVRLEGGEAAGRSGWTRPGHCCRARASPPGS